MNTLDTADLIDIAGIVILIAILAYMAVLAVLFIRRYKRKVSERGADAIIRSDFDCPNARKRVMRRITHNRRHALFAGSPDSRAGAIREMKTNAPGCRGIQRGLLKDKP